MDSILILLVGGLIVLLRKLFLEGGLAKLLGKLDSDLHPPDRQLGRTTPPPFSRQIPSSLSPEEERMRKFREALGLPTENLPSRQATPPILPRQPMIPAGRNRPVEPEVRPAPVKRYFPPSRPLREEATVARYFGVEEFDRPPVKYEKISIAVPVDSPVTETGFFKVLKKEPAPILPHSRLSELIGSPPDFRRMILAQEILGRPKSLQNH